jgi:hypothetical protein
VTRDTQLRIHAEPLSLPVCRGVNKRMRQFDKVDIPQEAFIAASKVDV